ncbi:MAG: hypothetical protein HOP16_12695 [Acidobacteria bacterium]|nr:hypothetical protein [Acidobacteriota bacterium]
MKILFVWDSGEYLRFYDSVVEECVARGHEVSLAVVNDSYKKPVGVEGLKAAYADRVRVLGVVPEHQGTWGAVAQGLRGIMDFARYLHPRFAAATSLRARMKRKVLPEGFHWLDAIPQMAPSRVEAVERFLMAAERAIPVCKPIAEFLDVAAPDVVLVSPLIDAASEQVDLIKAARARGIRSAACVASWDNLTNKGLLRVEPDRVIVWNEVQKREAVEYHYIPEQKVVATGAQLFDRWFMKTTTRDRKAFCERVGLRDERPFLLFTGSSSFISESKAEVAFVRRWIDALRESGDAFLKDINILVRPHPYNCHAWDPDPLADLPGAAFFPRTGYNPIDPDNRADFFDSMYHSTAIVGINTSAMIEAAIIGRPVFSMLAEEFSGTQEGTIHFHHLLPENGGCVRIASTLDEHVAQLSDRLRDPEAARAETRRFIGSFIRPHGIDRPATPIFVDAIERLAAAPAPAPQPAPSYGFLLRPLILAAAAPGALYVWMTRPNPLKPVRRWGRRSVHRTGKATSKWWQRSILKPLRTRRWTP